MFTIVFCFFPNFYVCLFLGHVDPGESEYETALRETHEESGFEETQLSIVADFKKILEYNVRGKPKKVVYWLAKLNNPSDPVVLSDEHRDFKWLGMEDACSYIKFPDMIEVMKEAQEFLQTY